MALDFTDYEGVPEHTRGALERYVEHKFLPGGFLIAVLSNDLMGAVSRADAANIVALREICQFIYNRMPSNSWGSEQKIYNFIEEKFYERLDNKAE